MNQEVRTTTLVDIDRVAAALDVSRPTIWRWLHDEKQDFPRPIKIGENSTRWRWVDIENWIATRASQQGGA